MVEYLTLNEFKNKIYDFEKNKEWKYQDTTPAVIDFYADWCGPCKMIAPIIKDLAEEYQGKVKFYKVNTEQEQQLAAMFGIQSIPSLLFIPLDDQPQMNVGALPKNAMKDAIEKVLGVEA